MTDQSQHLKQDVTSALVAVGSNLANKGLTPFTTLSAAISAIQSDDVKVLKQSRVFQTPAYPPGSGPDFVNAALIVETTLDSQALLSHLHKAEADFGRHRAQRWGARTLDLDLLSFGQAVLPDKGTVMGWMDLPLAEQMARAPDRLILPHPRMHERAFVLGPLMDIAPDWTHPILKQTVAQLFVALPAEDRSSLQPLT